MKNLLLSIFLTLCVASSVAQASDAPTTTVEHLYYLRTRATSLSKLRADEMIDYCVTHKLGSHAFEDLYSQAFTTTIEIAKLLQVEGVRPEDPRVKILNKTYNTYLTLLREDAQRIQSALIREGQIASDTLDAIARDQK